MMSFNNTTTTLREIRDDPYEKAFTPICLILITLSSIICFIALLGNLMIAIVIIKRTYMQTPINWLLFNLALCDLAIVVITIPSNLVYKSISWPHGMVACKYLIMPVMEHFASVGILTHTAISYARFVVIRNAGNTSIITTKRVKVTIFLIWLISFVVLSATLMGLLGEFKLSSSRIGRLICVLEWASPLKRKIYRLSVFLMTYLIPVLITGYSYGRIHFIVVKNLKNVNILLPDEILTKRRKNSRRLNQTLFVMFLIFGITTLPLQLFMFFYDFRVFKGYHGAGKTFDLLLILFYTQILSNPLVLLYMGHEFRKELRVSTFCSCFIGLIFPRVAEQSPNIVADDENAKKKTTNDDKKLKENTRLTDESTIRHAQEGTYRQHTSITASYNFKTQSEKTAISDKPIDSMPKQKTTKNKVHDNCDESSHHDNENRRRLSSFSPFMEFSLGEGSPTLIDDRSFSYCGLDEYSYYEISPTLFEGLISETPI